MLGRTWISDPTKWSYWIDRGFLPICLYLFNNYHDLSPVCGVINRREMNCPVNMSFVLQTVCSTGVTLSPISHELSIEISHVRYWAASRGIHAPRKTMSKESWKTMLKAVLSICWRCFAVVCVSNSCSSQLALAVRHHHRCFLAPRSTHRNRVAADTPTDVASAEFSWDTCEWSCSS